MPTAAAASGSHQVRESVPYRPPARAVCRDDAASYRHTFVSTLMANRAFVKCESVRLWISQDCKEGGWSAAECCCECWTRPTGWGRVRARGRTRGNGSVQTFSKGGSSQDMGESIPIMGLAGTGSKLRTAIGPAKLAGQTAGRSTPPRLGGGALPFGLAWGGEH